MENQEQAPRSKWFGRGIYGSKDVPIRVLDGVIAALIAATLLLIVYFTVNGGFEVTFDTLGGSEVAAQEIRQYGAHLQEPEAPYKPGYNFQGWFIEEAGEERRWDFSIDKVGGDLVLYAKWTPAEVAVKFDLSGGTGEDGETELAPLMVTFGEKYGELPVPQKEGSTFTGWEYSGSMITADTVVQMTGEHVLTAVWK